MKRSLISLLCIMGLAITNAQTTSTYPLYGGGISTNSVVNGVYAGQAAAFDSKGILVGTHVAPGSGHFDSLFLTVPAIGALQSLAITSANRIVPTGCTTAYCWPDSAGIPTGYALFKQGNSLAWLSAGSGTNYWTLSGSNLYNNSGSKIGIGTTTPQYKLDVAGPWRDTIHTIFGSSGYSFMSDAFLFPDAQIANFPLYFNAGGQETRIGYNTGYVSFDIGQMSSIVASGIDAGHTFSPLDTFGVVTITAYDTGRTLQNPVSASLRIAAAGKPFNGGDVSLLYSDSLGNQAQIRATGNNAGMYLSLNVSGNANSGIDIAGEGILDTVPTWSMINYGTRSNTFPLNAGPLYSVLTQTNNSPNTQAATFQANIPALDSAQISAIISPQIGQTFFCTDCSNAQGTGLNAQWTGSLWRKRF